MGIIILAIGHQTQSFSTCCSVNCSHFTVYVIVSTRSGWTFHAGVDTLGVNYSQRSLSASPPSLFILRCVFCPAVITSFACVTIGRSSLTRPARVVAAVSRQSIANLLNLFMCCYGPSVMWLQGTCFLPAHLAAVALLRGG